MIVACGGIDQARERRPWEASAKVFAGSPRREKAQGATGRRCVNRALDEQGTLGRVKAQEPRPTGTARRFASGRTAGETVSGFVSSGNAAGTFREGNAPKGESQERCRRETRPASARREETVKRVTKP